MRDLLHAHPWLFYAVSALLVLCAYWRGRTDERRRWTGRRFRLLLPSPQKRFDPFLAPRRHLHIDLSQGSPLGQRVFTDRQLQ